MAITAQSVLDRVQKLLYDQAGVRWPNEEVLDWIADGQILVIQHVPESASRTVSLNLRVGTSQELEAQYSRLLDIIRNQGEDGATPGPAITIAERLSLDAIRPNWHEEEGDVVYHFVYEPDQNKRNFWVYPGPDAPLKVQAMVSPQPPATLQASTELLLKETYINPLVDWAMFRSLSKQADFGSAGPRGQAHAQAFAAAIGMEMTTKGLVDPNRKMRGQRNG